MSPCPELLKTSYGHLLKNRISEKEKTKTDNERAL